MKRLILLLIPLLIFSSCNFLPISSSSDETLKAPILNQVQKDIYEELDKVLDINSIVFRYPSYRGQHSPFIFYDMDNDGREEVIIFYSFKTNREELLAKVMVQDSEGKWRPFYDLPCYSNEITFIDFAPITTKDKSSMLIGWNEDGVEYLGIYLMNENDFSNEFISRHNGYLAHDINGDGMDELFLIENMDNKFYLKLYQMVNKELVSDMYVALSGEAVSVKQLIIGSLEDGSKAVYIDEAMGGASISYGTEIVKIAKEKLEILVGGNSQETGNNEKWKEFSKTFRTVEKTFKNSEAALCVDLNDDGIIEVPRISEYNTYGKTYNDDSAAPRLIQYMQLESNKLVVKYNSVRNDNFNYYVHIPEKWLGKVIIVDQPQKQEWRFFKANENNLPTTELFRIRVIYSNENRDEISDDDFLLGTKNLYKYYGHIPSTTNEELAVTEAEVKEMMFDLI